MNQTFAAPKSNVVEVGYVTSIRNYLIVLNGLPNVQISEIIVNQRGSRAAVTSLQHNLVEALMLDDVKISPNEMFARTHKQMSIEVGNYLLGRTINPLGIPIDGRGRFAKGEGQTLPIEQVAGGISTREFIKESFETGITMVDMLIPIAKGQRELLVGPAKSGKSGFIIDTIINQRAANNAKTNSSQKGVICVYALIGKPLVEIRRLIDILSINQALSYTALVATSSSDPASLIFLTPAVSLTVAEYFQRMGQDVLLILDDLGIHAKFYREISLLGNRSPGRESYPSDVFSLHARLMKRAGNFNDKNGNGSITALPIIETSFDDFSGYIPTNLMAMTDGHLMFNSSIRHRGIKPALDIPLSVSRVGKQTQSMVQKILADKVRTILAESHKLEALSRFGSEVSTQTQITLNQGKQLEAILNQTSLTFIPKTVQIILLGLVFTPFFKNKSANFVIKNKAKILKYLTSHYDTYTMGQKFNQIKEEEEFVGILNKLIPELQQAIGN